jgi:hypothetical protein
MGLERKCGTNSMALGLKHKIWGRGGDEAYAEMNVVDQSSKAWVQPRIVRW